MVLRTPIRNQQKGVLSLLGVGVQSGIWSSSSSNVLLVLYTFHYTCFILHFICFAIIVMHPYSCIIHELNSILPDLRDLATSQDNLEIYALEGLNLRGNFIAVIITRST